jgi:long-subunit fatty acid transport protein
VRNFPPFLVGLIIGAFLAVSYSLTWTAWSVAKDIDRIADYQQAMYEQREMDR